MAMQPQEWTLHALAVEVGRPYAVVARRLANVEPHRVEGRNKFYRFAEVLPQLYEGRERSDTSREDADTRRAIAEAEIAEAKSGQIKGDLVPVSETASELERAFTAIRARLLSIPPKLAPILSPENPAKARALLDAAVLEALAELEQTDGFDDEPIEEEPET